MYLICCTDTLLAEIANKQFKQKDIALTYAMAMKSYFHKADTPDWSAINKAIVARWTWSGLDRIKKRAQDILAGKVQP